MRRSLFIVFLLLTSYIFSLDIEVLETKNGYINYFSFDENGKKTSLLDPGTYLNSRIFIKDSDRRFYLRDQGKYVIDVKPELVTIKWRMETVDVIEVYRKTEIGYHYNITINNRTNKDQNIGVYLMFDTYLGEKDGSHFLIDNYKIIKNEKSYSGSEIPKSIISKNSREQGIEFRFMDSNNYLPNKLILGNWDRLAYSKKWPYNPKDGTMFSYGYYSINDSGIGLVYDGVNTDPNKSISYSFDLNIYDNSNIINVKSSKTEKETNNKKWINLERVDNNKDELEEPELIIVNDTSKDSEDTVNIISVPNKEVLDDTVLSNDTTGDLTTIEDEPKDINEGFTTTDSSKEELLEMLEYIQKKKRGEDVSDYDFDEEYILEKLKERNE